MKNFLNRDISNWRLVFITLIFLCVLAITMSDEIGLTDQHVRNLYYVIYCFLALSYADILWKKFSKRRLSDDILDGDD